MNTRKYTKFMLAFFLLFGVALIGQSQTLTFRVTNPKIGSGSGVDSLEFNIEMKSTVGEYVDQVQANFNFNTVAFGTMATAKLTTYNTGISAGSGLEGIKYQITSTLSNTKLNIAVSSNHSWSSGDNLPDYYELVGTGWTTLIKVRVKILDNTQLAGVYFYPTQMTQVINQLFVNNASGQGQEWSSIVLDETKTLQNLYLGRVFSGIYGWSQVGGTVNWTSSINTSVWDTAAIAATISGTNSLVNNLRIDAGARLKILPGGELKVAANTEINEPRGLWIASTAAGTGAFMDNGEGSVTYNTGGTARIERYVGQNKWHLIGIPLHTAYAQATFHDTYLKWYDEARSTTYANRFAKYRYVLNRYPAADSALTGDLRGWFHWSASALTGDYTVKYYSGTGLPIVSGALSRAMTHTAFTDVQSDGWNMVANMYPCPIDWEAGSGWTKTSVENTIYLWSPSAGDYATYNGTTHVGTLSGTRYIPAMQGFFVHATAAGTLGMDNPVKIFNSQAFWKDEPAYSELLDLNVEGNGYKDEAKVWFNKDATVDFDSDYDNYKLTGLDEAPQFYSTLSDGNYAAVNTLPWEGLNTVIPMGFSLKADAPVTITASNLESFKSGTKIYLEDIREANMHDLTVNPVYSFTASASDDPNRFVLHFYNPSWGIEANNIAGMQIYSFDEYVYVRNLTGGTTKGEIMIYDQLGRKVFMGKLQDIVLNKYLPGVNEGYYMVRVVTEDNSYTQKVYLK